MGIIQKAQAAIPAGKHTGIIINSELTTWVFDPSKGPEEIVEVTIQPAWSAGDGIETIPVTVSFTPVLNRLSALSKFLARLDRTPKEGAIWEPTSIIGAEVSFAAKRTEQDFVRVLKDTVTKA